MTVKSVALLYDAHNLKQLDVMHGNAAGFASVAALTLDALRGSGREFGPRG